LLGRGKMSKKHIAPAPILDLNQVRPEILLSHDYDPYIVATSGGFDPIHPGHLSCINDSAEIGDILVVIVNDDDFLKSKKGKPFMPLEHRCQIVSMIKGVDYVVPYHAPFGDTTVIGALEAIQPTAFTKGGDRKDKSSIPEWDICQELNINLILGVGMEKRWSSSNYLQEWGKFWEKS